MRLYTYFRSSSSYRVRLVLSIKKIPYEPLPVHLLRDGGQQRDAAYVEHNPMAQVPALVFDLHGKTHVLTQSVAIAEYLEERFPNPPLMPADALARAKTRSLVEIINSGIQPLQNLSLLNHLKSLSSDAHAFARRANETGLAALEKAAESSSFLVGDALTLADVFLIPQLYSARRFGVPTESYPKLHAIEQKLITLDEFRAASPEAQPDYEP